MDDTFDLVDCTSGLPALVLSVAPGPTSDKPMQTVRRPTLHPPLPQSDNGPLVWARPSSSVRPPNACLTRSRYTAHHRPLSDFTFCHVVPSDVASVALEMRGPCKTNLHSIDSKLIAVPFARLVPVSPNQTISDIHCASDRTMQSILTCTPPHGDSPMYIQISNNIHDQPTQTRLQVWHCEL